MPRKKEIVYDEPQKYNIGNGVRVTIEWPVGMRPKMQHLDTVVIIGDHACQSTPVFRSPDAFTTEPPDALPPRASNLLDTNSPEYQERLRMLESGGGRVAAPGATVHVFTSEDAFRESGIAIPEGTTLDANVLAAASPQKVV